MPRARWTASPASASTSPTWCTPASAPRPWPPSCARPSSAPACSPRSAPCSPRRSTTRAPCATWRGWWCPRSRTGASWTWPSPTAPSAAWRSPTPGPRTPPSPRRSSTSTSCPRATRATPPTAALLRGEAILLEEMTPAHIKRSAHNENHARVMLATGLRSFIAVPLVVRGHTMGVFSFFTSFSNRRYTQADLAFGLELAYRAALSMENARLYREAQEAIRLRDEFLSIASHELKTPLTPLSLKLQALSRELERHPDNIPYAVVKGYVDTGARQVKKLAELVGDLLDVSRIAAGRLALELEDVDLGALIHEVASRYEAHAARSGSSLQVEGGEAGLVGRWDRLRLEQVVTNLIDNAVKYGAGKPIVLSLEQGPSRARLKVRDQGIGIAPEHLPRLFGRFERAVSERHYGGLGLGLYITRTLVEAMGGRVRVESEQGRGSIFTVDLPRERVVPVDVSASQPQ
ncbi:ATP-binding protein [Myxococcus sp. MISCRS1]|uniref:ATP-binding protein n=1 Tax=Myxococcus sp. MISCRS1 TaxID=2996786 RepID=UPI00226FEEB3|nr:ATP-binding protein [Myxococcus sp. MISCRS1]MCY0999316.1 ATP-binding protein [Myxococcus sp. MISCRS1]